MYQIVFLKLQEIVMIKFKKGCEEELTKPGYRQDLLLGAEQGQEWHRGARLGCAGLAMPGSYRHCIGAMHNSAATCSGSIFFAVIYAGLDSSTYVGGRSHRT